jgi:ABC-2 type transport system permease protein
MSAAAYQPAVPAPRPASWRRKYFNIFLITLAERSVYRVDFLATFLRFLPVVTSIMVWQAVYAGDNRSVKGYTLHGMVVYLLLGHVSRVVAGMSGLASGIAHDIRGGGLQKYLLQPIELLPYLLSCRIAYKATEIVAAVLPCAVLFAVYYEYFTLPAQGWTWLAYILSLLLSFAIAFYFEAAIGMTAFWFLEVSSFLYVVSALAYFLSGAMFPLDLLPAPWGRLFQLLPFQYFAYFPATVFLEQVTGWELARGLLVEAAWVVAFAAAARWLYRMGLRRYGAYGG